MTPSVHWRDEMERGPANGYDASSTSTSTLSSLAGASAGPDRRRHRPSVSSAGPFAVTRRAVLELPIDVSGHPEATRTPLPLCSLSLRPASKLSLQTSVPLRGSWSASLDAHAGVRGRNGYLVTKTGVQIPWGPQQRLSLVSLWNAAGHMERITISSETTQPEASHYRQWTLQSSSWRTLPSQTHSDSIPRRLASLSWKPTMVWTTPLTEVVRLRTHLRLAPVDTKGLSATRDYIQQVTRHILSSSDITPESPPTLSSSSSPLTLADCPCFKPTQYGIGLESLRTRHTWSLRYSHSRSRPHELHWSLAPQLAHGRSLRLGGVYPLHQTKNSHRLTGLQFVWSDTTHASPHRSQPGPGKTPWALSQVSVGCSDTALSSSGTWVWTVGVTTRGNLTLRLPLVIATAALADPLRDPLQTLYLAAVSGLLQEVLVGIMKHMTQRPAERPDSTENDTERRRRERQEAENQQTLMKFQASRRKAAEKEANGLLINVAVYYTAKERLDVTIPLRFWVADSSLTLAATSKAQLLGFCDISTEKKSSRRKKQPSWISGFWRKETHHESESSPRVRPKLSVEYTYRGSSYQLTVEDDEELVLPNDRARLVRAA